MADWDTAETSSMHSRQSSDDTNFSSFNKENILQRLDSEQSCTDSQKELVLQGGTDLKEESRTDRESIRNGYNIEIPELPPNTKAPPPYDYIGMNGSEGTVKSKIAKSPHGPSTIDSIPEEAVTIPSDGNLASFTADQMANFFRCLKLDDRLISHLHRKNVDGKRFSRLRDSELENIGLKEHPVILFFKEKSSTKKTNKSKWIL